MFVSDEEDLVPDIEESTQRGNEDENEPDNGELEPIPFFLKVST